MQQQRWWLAVLAVAVLGAGCIQDQKTIKLKRDGSGTLVEELFMSPQMTGMMEQMATGMAGTMGANMSAADKAKLKAVDPLAMFKSDIEKRTAALGPNVKLVSAVAQTNAAGWKGYALTYSFADITKLNFSMSDQKSGGGGMGPGQESGPAEPLLLEFRKAPTPAITFRQKALAKAPSAKPGDKKEGADAGAAPDADAMPPAMLSAMLQGMRVSCVVEVDGKITRTNSHYQQGNNRIVLMDLPMDKVLAHAAGAKMIQGGKDDPDMLAKLRALQIPGLALEDLERGISIEWQ